MKITVEDILSKKPCNWTEEKLRKYLGDGKTPLEALDIEGVSISDKIWCATRFLPDELNRKFAIWCARRCKTDIKEITDYIDVIERFYAGEATKEELKEAYWAAYWAADSAAYWAADSAADKAADWAAYWAADSAAYWAAYWAADKAADRAADRAADSAATKAADSAAYWAAGRKEQLCKLKELITEALKGK